MVCSSRESGNRDDEGSRISHFAFWLFKGQIAQIPMKFTLFAQIPKITAYIYVF